MNYPCLPRSFTQLLSRSLLVGALSLFTVATTQASTTLVSETFDTGVTFTGWYSTGTITNPPLFGDARNNNSTTNQFFTTSFESTALEVGDSITATFQYNPFSENINTVRVGLFSGTAASANGWDQWTDATSPSSTWTGYIGNLAIGSGNSLASLKGTSGTHAFFGAQTGSASEAEFFGTGAFRVASLKLERSVSGTTVTLSEGANLGSLATVVSYEDTTSAITNFNIFSLYFTTTGGNGDIRYDNVTVTAVPEPSTAAALIGVTAVAFTVMRRRLHN